MTDPFPVVPFDIDVVYTWVDGTDARWLAERQTYSAAPDHAADAHDAARWEDYGMLKWSLRSVAKNMPWVRQIFLVTDDQRPAWLKEDSKLRVVTHAELFAGYVARPTFNSHVIESQLHRIEGLSEQFLYLNDDVLITRQAEKFDFFLANGTPRIFPGSQNFGIGETARKAVDVAGRNLQSMLAGRFQIPPTRKMKHSVFALKRSILQQLEAEFAREYSALGTNRFRSNQDFAPVTQLFPHYAYLTGQAVPSDIDTAYVDIGEKMALKNWIKLLTLKDYLTVCVNSSLSNAALLKRNAAWSNRILRRAFSQPCRWEVS